MLAALALLLGALLAVGANPAHATTTFTVNSTADPGTGGCDTTECTLREAIDAANSASNITGLDQIVFKIPTNDPGRDSTTGVFTIKPSSPLPMITDPVTINGYSQPWASPNTKAVGNNAVLKIELDGSGAGSVANGLTISAGSSTVRGLVINRFYAGIDLRTGPNNTVQGNFLGTDPTGSTGEGNGTGVRVQLGSNTNTIGGATPSARNLLSGNAYGFQFSNATSGNKVQGNYVGTKKNGTESLPNSFEGMGVAGNNHVIGGASSGERNVISGNGRDGVRIAGNSNQVRGNYIGADAAGAADLGNGRHGVFVDGSIFISNNTIGGTTAGVRNVISGNDQNGISIVGDRAINTIVQGNYIGTKQNGTADLANANAGLEINSSSNNTIGGTVSGARNVIAFNDTLGIRVLASTGNRILSNSIFSNGFLGIDLNGDGVTPNDTGDGDTGANDLQNYPVLTSVKVSRKKGTTVTGTLNSTPGATFTLQLFAGPSGDEEGKRYLGSKSVTTDSGGDVSFVFKTRKKASGEVTATATNDATGDTSEFSTAIAVQ